MKILVVDDELISRMILQELMESYGNVHAVNNGADAIEFFKFSLDKNEPYDLICLDIMMPSIDGHKVLERIREIEKKKNIFGNESVKIVMVTALSDGKNVIKAFKGQCEAYIVKPVEKKKLEETLKKLKIIRKD